VVALVLRLDLFQGFFKTDFLHSLTRDWNHGLSRRMRRSIRFDRPSGQQQAENNAQHKLFLPRQPVHACQYSVVCPGSQRQKRVTNPQPERWNRAAGGEPLCSSHDCNLAASALSH
jgi:hypothetical protein